MVAKKGGAATAGGAASKKEGKPMEPWKQLHSAIRWGNMDKAAVSTLSTLSTLSTRITLSTLSTLSTSRTATLGRSGLGARTRPWWTPHSAACAMQRL